MADSGDLHGSAKGVEGRDPDTAVAACGIAVMAKASKAGRTKTRLSPPLSPDAAAELNTAFLHDCADNLVAASALASCQGYMAYGPPGEEPFFAFLPQAVGLIPAWAPDFGDTLAAAVSGVLTRGHGAACLINADSPTLPADFLAEAVERLAAPGERIVIGPSTDGGYYLIGMKRLHRRLFEDITWSTEVVMAQTRERAAELGLDVVLLPEWYDVDDATSLDLLRGELFDGRSFDPRYRSSPARHARALLQALFPRDTAR